MPTYRKTAEVELRQLKACLLKLVDDLTVRADKTLPAPATDAVARHANEERALGFREQALALRYLIEGVEAMDPALDESKFKGMVLMAASKASLTVRKSGA